MAKSTEIFHADGRLRGVSLLQKSGKRDLAISLALKDGESICNTSYLIRNGNFTNAWAKAVARVAEFHGIGAKSKQYAAMLAAKDVFLAHHKLKVKEVIFEVVV